MPSRIARPALLGLLVLLMCGAAFLVVLPSVSTPDAEPRRETRAPAPSSNPDPIGPQAPKSRAPKPLEPQEQTKSSATTDSAARDRVTSTATRVFPLVGCEVGYSVDHHHYPATDMFAPAGCSFVSPVAGRVDEVGRRDEWVGPESDGATRGGLFVSVVGDDGVRYYGSHLTTIAPAIEAGAMIAAGDLLGTVGITGSARYTPPHLHFGLSWPTPPGRWWVRRGAVPPARYLDAWREGIDLSPVAEVRSARRAAGDTSRCRVYC